MLKKSPPENDGLFQHPAGAASFLARIFLFIFIFSQPLKHVASVKEVSFYAMLAFFLAGNKKMSLVRKIKGSNDFTFPAFLSLVSISLLSALLSPYPFDSLNAFGKNMFVEAVIFLVVLAEFDSFADMKPLILAAASGFMALSAIIFIELASSHGSSLSTISGDIKREWGGYSLLAVFYIPFTAGCFFIARSGIIKTATLAVVTAESSILVLYGDGGRTSVAAILFSILVLALLSRKFLYILLTAGLLSVFSAGAYLVKPGLIKPYTLPVSYDIFRYPSMVERYAIWSGTADIAIERPFLGYGYGWKKLSRAAREGGFLERWSREKRPEYEYFSRTGYGSANPHNLLLQIIFETGLLGLGAFIAFWACIYRKALRAFFTSGVSEGKLFISYGVLGVLLAYVIINITNGLWEEASGNLMMMLSAITVAACREEGDLKSF